MKPCSQNFHIVPLICSFQEIEIRLFSGTLVLGVKGKVSRGQTLKYHLKSDYKTHSLYKDMIQLCPWKKKSTFLMLIKRLFIEIF